MQGQVPDCAITIGGRVDEWTSEFTSFEDGTTSVVVRNAEWSLYVTATISDPELAPHVMACALVFWLDSDDGTDHVFGIPYPIGVLGNRLGERAGERHPLDDDGETAACVASVPPVASLRVASLRVASLRVARSREVRPVSLEL
jgi:hypothetical protein